MFRIASYLFGEEFLIHHQLSVEEDDHGQMGKEEQGVAHITQSPEGSHVGKLAKVENTWRKWDLEDDHTSLESGEEMNI